MLPDDPCACGTGDPFGSCCLPIHIGERQAQSAEQLMRTRYSAYAVGNSEYLWRTWHPRTRPDAVTDSGLVWIRLEIIDTVAGEPGDEAGEVEFRAYYREARRQVLARGERQRSGTLHERSRFVLRARRWFYVDGDVDGAVDGDLLG